jgi:hypothetical protein
MQRQSTVPRRACFDAPKLFPASYGGHCGGCGMPYQQGDMIWSPGKGRGAYHPYCDRRTAKPKAQAKRAAAQDAIREWNARP